jgi:hypothetical protein
MKSNKLAKGADARVVTIRPVGVESNVCANRLERSLPEQAINKGDRRSVIKHEPVISRQRHAELAQVRQDDQTIA